MSKSNIIVDLDDTAIRTYPFMYQKCVERGVQVPYGDYLTPANTGGMLRDLLDTATFMLHLEAYEQMYNTLMRLKDIGHNILCCTHRGYHKDAEKFTHQNLADQGMSDLFEKFYFLDSDVHPRKTEFLDAELGTGNYIILDDRPHGKEKPEVNNVLLFSQPWNAGWDMPRIDNWDFTHVATGLAQVQAQMENRENNGVFYLR